MRALIDFARDVWYTIRVIDLAALARAEVNDPSTVKGLAFGSLGPHLRNV